MNTLLLSSDDIRALVRYVGLDRLMDEAIEGLEAVLSRFRPDRFDAPPRGGFHYQAPEPGLLEWMPVMEPGGKVTIKLVGYHPTNPRRGLPTVLSTAVVFETGSGHLTTVMDATFATALRTGAASAVASRVLAEPESRTLGLIGCGAQAVSQLHAVFRTFPIERVLLHDIDPSAEASMRERARGFGLPEGVELRSASAETVLSASDIVCTQTSVAVGEGPVVEDVEVRPHLHVNAVGSDFRGKIELPLGLLERSVVCPDFRAQAVREGECQLLAEDRIGPDLYELVQHRELYAALRSSPTVFDSTGWALEDHATVAILAAHARDLGLGRMVELEVISPDPSNPYGGVLEVERRVAAGGGSGAG